MNTKPWEIYSKEENARIDEFCKEHTIKRVGQEYYFIIGDTEYKVSPNKTEVNDHITNAFPWENAKACKKVIIQGKRGELIDIYNSLKESSANQKEPEKPVEEIKKKVRLKRIHYREEPEDDLEIPITIHEKVKDIEVIPKVEPEIIETPEVLKPTKIKELIRQQLSKKSLKKEEQSEPVEIPESVEESEPVKIEKTVPSQIKISNQKSNSRLTQKEAMNILLKKR